MDLEPKALYTNKNEGEIGCKEYIRGKTHT
jgi:hypothetical protein